MTTPAWPRSLLLQQQHIKVKFSTHISRNILEDPGTKRYTFHKQAVLRVASRTCPIYSPSVHEKIFHNHTQPPRTGATPKSSSPKQLQRQHPTTTMMVSPLMSLLFQEHSLLLDGTVNSYTPLSGTIRTNRTSNSETVHTDTPHPAGAAVGSLLKNQVLLPKKRASCYRQALYRGAPNSQIPTFKSKAFNSYQGTLSFIALL